MGHLTEADCICVSLQVSCVSNSFEQPVDPVVSQDDQETHTSLQENPTNGITYGSTDWPRGPSGLRRTYGVAGWTLGSRLQPDDSGMDELYLLRRNNGRLVFNFERNAEKNSSVIFFLQRELVGRVYKRTLLCCCHREWMKLFFAQIIMRVCVQACGVPGTCEELSFFFSLFKKLKQK